jgi:methyltransferase (TIGR00027 family)
MRGRASFTAAMAAMSRSLGSKLPADARLVDDPFGATFAGRVVAFFTRHAPRIASRSLGLYMQVRTRAIDDVLRTFLASGGRQVLLLGAGYDSRALRFAGDLGDARVFEVDHPATQAKKQQALARIHAPTSSVAYLGWDFEARPVSELPAALAAVGHDPSIPTLTIWEGVTMYLTESAIESSVNAVRALSAPSSPFVVTYLDRERIERPSRSDSLMSRMAERLGEPFRFGWSRSELPRWFGAHGFEIEWNRRMGELARMLLPEAYARAIREYESGMVLLRRAATA